MKRGLTHEQFIEKCRQKHGDKYIYLSTYTNNKNKLKILCPVHGEFEQLACNHIRNNGCYQCWLDGRKLSQSEFQAKSFEVHKGKYHCLDNYDGGKRKLRFLCKEHGEFSQTAGAHLSGQGCPVCAYKTRQESTRLTHEEFLRRSREVHGDKYECLDTYVNDSTKLTFVCKLHGQFKSAPMNYMRQGQGCPSCCESNGEKLIDQYLRSKGFLSSVDYFREHRFDDCRKKRTLPFDFYIPAMNLIIEYDGALHFMPAHNGAFGGEEGLKQRQENDRIKNEYCTRNNIKLVRIPYTHYDQVETILDFVLEDLKQLELA